MKRTGERLKASREEQKLTISEVSLSTKINPRVLQAMEAGQLEKLPAISFLRGFIRTYASFLKLDGNELLELFSEELEEEKQSLEEDGAETPEEAPAPWHQSVPLLKDSSVTSRSLAAGGVVLLIIVILGIKNLVDKYEREGDVAEPPANIESLKHEGDGKTPSGDKLKTADKEPAVPPPPKPEAKPQAVAPPKPAPKEEAEPEEPPVVSTQEAMPTEEIKKVEEEKTKPAPEQKPKPEEVADAREESKPSVPQEIILEALDQVEVSFRIDGGKLEKMILKPEQIHTFKGRGSVAIDLSDGGAVNVIHNGIDRGVPGDLGKPKKIKYP